MWVFLLKLIGGPIITGIIDGYKAKLAAQNTTDAQAADLAKAEILGEIQSRQAEASIIRQEEGRWYTAYPRPAFAFIFLIYYGKCVIWDTVLGLGTTPPLGPDLVWTSHIVITGYFGGRTIEKVARVFRR